MADVFVTAEGYKELEEKLDYLKTVRRAEISAKIQEARSFGDISENAEYDAAKDEQALVEGEICEIEAKLHSAVIINETGDTSNVKLGFKITVIDQASKKRVKLQLVGTTEVDPFAEYAKISNESPLGRALLGKKNGQEVEVALPQGKKKYKIVSITK